MKKKIAIEPVSTIYNIFQRKISSKNHLSCHSQNAPTSAMVGIWDPSFSLTWDLTQPRHTNTAAPLIFFALVRPEDMKWILFVLAIALTSPVSAGLFGKSKEKKEKEEAAQNGKKFASRPNDFFSKHKCLYVDNPSHTPQKFM